jgi:hypothetical protein
MGSFRERKLPRHDCNWRVLSKNGLFCATKMVRQPVPVADVQRECDVYPKLRQVFLFEGITH